ncbi:MAG: hypothetical protein KDK27_10065, partial [Leptospiraceae bacterium]|nr:hypothetical protein [Leptospiraceae bacterium]
NASHLFLASLADLTIEKTYHPSTVIGNKRVPAYFEYNVLSAIDVQVIEVETSEILYSESIEGEFNQGSRARLDTRSERALVLNSLDNCFEDMRPRIQESLPLRTVIIAMRGNREIALIPAGHDYGVQVGARFDILFSITQRTAVGNRTFTDTVGELEIFSVHTDTAWGMISGNEDKIKIGSPVRLKPQPISNWRSMERWFNRNFTNIE